MNGGSTRSGVALTLGAGFGSVGGRAAAGGAISGGRVLVVSAAVAGAFFWGLTGGTAGAYRYWNTNITAPINRKASSSRISIGMSFDGPPLFPPSTGSGILKSSVTLAHSDVTGRGRNRPRERDDSAPGGAAPSTLH